jgi:hypothetical protein
MPAMVPTVETLATEIKGLRELLSERDRRMEERFAGQQLALTTATDQLQEYKNVANEWGGALSDARNGTLTRTEYEAKHQALLDRIDAMVLRLGPIEVAYKQRVSSFTLWLMGGGIAVSLVFNLWEVMRAR